jgi:hypothetical protein
MRRFNLAIAVTLLLSGVCGARQFPPTKPAPVQHQPGIPLVDRTPVSAATPDALIAQVAQQIVQKHLKSVVVIGVAGPMPDEPTQFGSELGDKFSTALAKQSDQFRVEDRGELRALVKKNGVSDAMVVSDALGNWIATKAGVEGYAVVEFTRVASGGAEILVSLYRTDKEDGYFLSSATTTMDLALDQYTDGLRAIDSNWNKETHPGKDGDTLPSGSMPTCVDCHSREMTELARKAGHSDDGKSTFKETGVLFVTVLPDGKANEIAVIKSANYGLNGSAVDSVLNWEFKPAIDALGKPVSFRVKVEFAWQLY